MPDPIVCPHCQEHLDIPAEYHGRQVRCAACQAIFLALPAESTPTIPPLSGRRGGGDQPPWRDPRPVRRPRPDDEDDRPPRQSNLGVIVLMLFTVLVVGGCCGGMNLIIVMQTNPQLTPYTSAEGKFKVDFPDDNPVGGPIAGGEGKAAADRGWQVTAGRPMANERYTVRTYPLRAEWRELTAEDALVKVCEAELTALGAGPEIRGAMTTHADFPARDALAGKGNGLAREETILRCILAGDQVYAVAVQAPNVEPRFWWIRQFFLSFDVTDPAAKPPAKKDE